MSIILKWKPVKKPNQILKKKKKMSDAFKADRAIRRVTFNPNKASPRETLTAPVPKLDDGVVLMPGSLSLIFELVAMQAIIS